MHDDSGETSIWVDDVRVALEAATKLRDEGKFDLFRGQIRNFPVCPSIFRPRVNRAESVGRLERFAAWVSNTPELVSLHSSPDAILAVAQHYNIPTSFLDFSRNPEVAAFFAADGKLPNVDSDDQSPSCILCVNRQHLERYWAEFNVSARRAYGIDLVRIVDVHVQNLWRLHAQDGVFLSVQADATMLEMFSGFFRILFPYTGPLCGVARSRIYPDRKSHLEVLLDQFFSAEEFASSLCDAARLFDKAIKIGSESFVGEETCFLGGKFPPEHASWSDGTTKIWLSEPDEFFTVLKPTEKCTIQVNTSDSPSSISANVQRLVWDHLGRDARTRQHSIEWEVLNQDEEVITVDDEWSESSDDQDPPRIPCSKMVSRIWEGMRRLPYEDQDVAVAIARYLAMAIHGLDETSEDIHGSMLEVDLGAGGSRTRALASEAELRKCFRSDILDYLLPVCRQECADADHGVEALLSMLVAPSLLFEFGEFVSLFARELIPSQAKIRHDPELILFNPARISVFGNS